MTEIIKRLDTSLLEILDLLKAELKTYRDYCDLKDAMREWSQGPQDRPSSLLRSTGILGRDGGRGANYDKLHVRLLYQLRYAPAYVSEYRFLYRAIVEEKHVCEPIRVLSVGCGCGLDWASLEAECQPVPGWDGVDIVRWEEDDDEEELGRHFHTADIGMWEPPSAARYNIIIFPKSLADIPESSWKSFLSRLASSFVLDDRIVIAVSYSSERCRSTEVGRLGDLVKRLDGMGFESIDSLQDAPMGVDGRDRGLRKIDPDFHYPDRVIEWLETLSARCPRRSPTSILGQAFRGECHECHRILDKKPILTAWYLWIHRVRMRRIGA